MAKGFASTSDMAEKKITFSEIGTDLYAFTAEGDPNTAVIVGDDGVVRARDALTVTTTQSWGRPLESSIKHESERVEAGEMPPAAFTRRP